MESSKKKEKKIVGVTGGLPPHKEEPEETKKSSFAEALNLKNISQSNMIKTAEPLQSLSSPINNEPETNGEPEILPVPPPAVPAPQPAKHHEKQKQHEEHVTHQQHDRKCFVLLILHVIKKTRLILYISISTSFFSLLIA